MAVKRLLCLSSGTTGTGRRGGEHKVRRRAGTFRSYCNADVAIETE